MDVCGQANKISRRVIDNASVRRILVLKRSGSHIYLKRNVYYFRYAFSKKDSERLSHREIRLSLQTRFVRKARVLAKKLKFKLNTIVEVEPMLEYDEIVERLRYYLKKLLEANDLQVYNDEFFHYDNFKFSRKEMYKAQLATFKENLNNFAGTKNSIKFRIDQLITNGVFNKDEINEENAYRIVKEYEKNLMNYLEIAIRREEGDFLYEIPFLNSIKSNIKTDLKTKKTKKYRITEIINKYLDDKLSNRSIKKVSIPDYQKRLFNLVEILGDVYINDITREDVRKFRDILIQLPPNRTKSKKYRDKSIEEMLKMKIGKKLSTKTVNTSLEAVSSLFEWCVKEQIVSTNPAKGLQIKDERRDVDLRNPFSVDDLNKIFSHQNFTRAKKNMAYYWVPYIALYTGMRLEEICQLYVDDIYEIDGIYVIDINDNPNRDGEKDKRVKTINSKRIVPLHNDLIALGFIKYRDQVIKSKNERLFPKLKKSKSVDTYGHAVSKKFSKIVQDCGLTGIKSFHSFRHTFADYFKKLHLQNDLFKEIYGHRVESLAARQYGSRFPVKQCYDELISIIKFDINIKGGDGNQQ